MVILIPPVQHHRLIAVAVHPAKDLDAGELLIALDDLVSLFRCHNAILSEMHSVVKSMRKKMDAKIKGHRIQSSSATENKSWDMHP